MTSFWEEVRVSASRGGEKEKDQLAGSTFALLCSYYVVFIDKILFEDR
jgi:hypothetical protein